MDGVQRDGFFRYTIQKMIPASFSTKCLKVGYIREDRILRIEQNNGEKAVEQVRTIIWLRDEKGKVKKHFVMETVDFIMEHGEFSIVVYKKKRKDFYAL